MHAQTHLCMAEKMKLRNFLPLRLTRERLLVDENSKDEQIYSRSPLMVLARREIELVTVDSSAMRLQAGKFIEKNLFSLKNFYAASLFCDIYYQQYTFLASFFCCQPEIYSIFHSLFMGRMKCY